MGKTRPRAGRWSENSSARAGNFETKLEIGGAHILRRSVLIVLPCIRGSSQRLPTSWRFARTGAVVDVYP